MDKPQQAAIPDRLYRFRPLAVVKPSIVEGKVVPGKTVVEELEHQEIFVARLDELNDPMDGLHHTVWDGDSVVWQNFIRSYARCLLDAVTYVYIAGDTAPFDSGVVHTLKTPDDSPTDEYTALYEDLVRGVEGNDELQALLRELCRRQKLQREELHALLSIHQPSFLREVSIALKAHGDMDLLPGMSDRPRTVNLRKLVEILPQLGDRVLSVAGEVGHRTNEQLYLIERYSSRETHSTGRDNLMRIIGMFPYYYLEAAAEDIYGESYVASFSRSADDSSMWAHYAEQHRGICLIFEPGDADEHRVIETGDRKKFALYPVDYREDPAEINFFESLGKLNHSKLDNGWLRLEGKISRLAAAYDDSYPKRYWARFREKVSRKSPNWEYEEEVRLVRDSQFTGRLEPKDRILHYKFDHLVGIIFGMKTPVEEQVRIMEVIERKLGGHPEKEFKFYKADYSASRSRFAVNELGLLKLKPEVESEE